MFGFYLQAAAPKKWRGFDGKATEMDTPFTIRAKELRDIYNSINMKFLTQDERLDVLLTLKHTVKVNNCAHDDLGALYNFLPCLFICLSARETKP